MSFSLSSARIDPRDMADSKVIKESADLSETKILKRAGLNESSPSGPYKDTSPADGAKKPEAQIVEEAPSSTPTPLGKAVDDEVMIARTHQGIPPAKILVAKVVDSKEQVKSRPRELFADTSSLEELYKRSLACTTEYHDIVVQLRQHYEVFFSAYMMWYL